MYQRDIRSEIDKYYEIIDKSLTPGEFMLNVKVMEINEQIDLLREQCEHEFKDGICIYCDLPEEFVE